MTRRSSARAFITEALSVTAGVLLAFSVDAWWSRAQERRAVEALQAAAGIEATANKAALTEMRARGDNSLRSARALTDHISPRPAAIGADSLGTLFNGLLYYGAVPLELAALDRLLSSAEADALPDEEVHQLLLRYRALASDYRSAATRFDDVHEAVITTFGESAPTTFLSAIRKVHGPTDFPVDFVALLSDPDLEGAVGNLAVWTDNLNTRVDRLVALSDSIWGSGPD